MVELTLINLPKEQEGRVIPAKQYILRPRRWVANPIYASTTTLIVRRILFIYSNHSSQRSRVKGTLEVYHAYVSESTGEGASAEGETAPDSGGWELLDQPNPATNDSPVEQPAQVCTRLCIRVDVVSVLICLFLRR